MILFAPMEILLELLEVPNPARYPRKTPFFTLEVDAPAFIPINVLLEFDDATRVE